MKRQAVYDYYSALNASSRLIDIDCKDSLQTIEQKLLKIPRDSVGTFHVEIFKDDDNIQSYSLSEIYQNANNASSTVMYNLWEEKTSKMQNTSIDGIAEYIFNNMPKDVVIPHIYCVVGIDVEKKTLSVREINDTTGLASSMPIPTSAKDAEKILGCFTEGNKVTEIHTVNSADLSDFEEIIENIENPRIKKFAQTYIRLIPDYVFSVPLNGSSEDRNASDAEKGGLKRHCINMARIVMTLSKLDFYKIKFSSDEVDKMIVACLFSAFLKSGWQNEYEVDSNTRPDYPRTEAHAIKHMTGILEKRDLTFIANLIESHLGQPHNEKYNLEKPLPLPDTECKAMIHIAHALSSNDNVAIKGSEGFYIFSEDTVINVDKTVEMPNNVADVLRLAMDRDVDMELAKSLAIHRTSDGIRKIWSEMLATNKYTPQQQKYIDLATRMQFF